MRKKCAESMKDSPVYCLLLMAEACRNRTYLSLLSQSH
jgi:hypothetical protein